MGYNASEREAEIARLTARLLRAEAVCAHALRQSYDRPAACTSAMLKAVADWREERARQGLETYPADDENARAARARDLLRREAGYHVD
jgi:hypothetical protein